MIHGTGTWTDSLGRVHGRMRDQARFAVLGLVAGSLLGLSLAHAGTGNDEPAAQRPKWSDHRKSKSDAVCTIAKESSKPRAVLTSVRLAVLGGGTSSRKSGDACRPALRPAVARLWLEAEQQEVRPA